MSDKSYWGQPCGFLFNYFWGWSYLSVNVTLQRFLSTAECKVCEFICQWCFVFLAYSKFAVKSRWSLFSRFQYFQNFYASLYFSQYTYISWSVKCGLFSCGGLVFLATWENYTENFGLTSQRLKVDRPSKCVCVLLYGSLELRRSLL